MSLNRNAKCWCGSGKKYSDCHLIIDNKIADYAKMGAEVPSRDLIKTKKDIEGIKKSALVNNGVLDFIAKEIKSGMSTQEIDDMVYEYTVSHGGFPAPLNYDGFPKSVCTSINDEVCHGIPDKRVILQEGDIINVDVSTIVDGYYSDASRMFMIGRVSPEAERLVKVAKECMEKGIEAIKPWGFLGDVGAACGKHAHDNGYTIVRDLGGHGVGKEFHEDPFVMHIGEPGTDMLLVPGMVFTVEPMVNEGVYDVYQDIDNGWTIYTDDGKLSAQWEHTVLVTETGVEILAW